MRDNVVQLGSVALQEGTRTHTNRIREGNISTLQAKMESHQPPRLLLIEPDIKLRAQLRHHFKGCGYTVTVARQHGVEGYDIEGVTRPAETGKAAFDLIVLGEEGNVRSRVSVADRLRCNNRFSIPVLLTANEKALHEYSPDSDTRYASYIYALDRGGLMKDEKGRMVAASLESIHDMAVHLQRLARKARMQILPLWER